MILTRSARRSVRRIAGAVAMLLFAGNVLAAAGLCALKAPAAEAAAPAASEAPCPDHLADRFAPPLPAAQHCPADDPSAQARTGDLPGAQIAAAVDAQQLSVAPAASINTPPRSDPGSTQRPLYARLQRLQL
jgi:hypothetical protein